MRKHNSLLRPLTEEERATIRRLLLEYLQAVETAKEAIEQHLHPAQGREPIGQGAGEVEP